MAAGRFASVSLLERLGREVESANPEAQWQTKTAGKDLAFDGNRWWLELPSGEWCSLAERAIRRELKGRGFRDKPDPTRGEVLSPLDAELRRVEQECRVDWAGVLAGWQAGVHEIGGGRILVTKSAKLVQPVQGDCTMLRSFIEGLLNGEELEVDGQPPRQYVQAPYFFAWTAHALESLYTARRAPGMCLAIAGPTSCGKTLLASILRVLFGGGCGRPYSYMVGLDSFNGELFNHVLQLVDDERAETDIRSRLKFGAEVKKFTAADGAKCRGLHRDGIELTPVWRLLCLLNEEPDRLLVLPPIDEDVADKILLLRAYRKPMPMPAATPAEREAFWDAITAQLPAFVWWLLHEYKMPAEMTAGAGRFGLPAYHHPVLLSELQAFSPPVRLWQLIERGVLLERHVGDGETTWLPLAEWRGSASDLEQKLKDYKNALSDSERREVPTSAWIGHRLADLSRRMGEQVVKCERRVSGRVWVIRRPADGEAASVCQ